MKEKLKTYALFAEVISSIAVLATLIILLTQIIEGNKIEKASSYQSVIRSLNDWRISLYSDIGRIELINKYNRTTLDGASEVEELQITLILLSVWNIYDGAYSANLAGVIDDDDWARLSSGACSQFNYLNRQPPGYFKNTINGLSSVDFLDYLEDSCK